MDEQFLRTVQSLPAEVQRDAWLRLYRAYPFLAERPALRAQMLAHAIDYKSAPLAAETALRCVQAMAERLGLGRLERPSEVGEFLERMAFVTTLLAGVFVALRTAVSTFRREAFGISSAAVSTEWVEKAGDGDGLLQTLLHPEHPPAVLTEGIRRAFADLVSHQHGMFVGFRAAARVLLERFAPGLLYAEAQTHRPPGLWFRLVAHFQAYREHLAWRLFSARHAAMLDDERDILDVLTGSEFLRAYNRIAGPG